MERDQHVSLNSSQNLRSALSEGVSWTKASGQSRHRFELLGVVDFAEGQTVTAHAHPFCEIGLVLEGEGRLQLRRESFTLERNGIYMVQPGVSHKVLAANSSGFQCIVLHVTSERIQGEGLVKPLPGMSGTGVRRHAPLGEVIQSWARLFESRQADAVSLSLFARFLATEIVSVFSDSGDRPDSTVVEQAKLKIEQGLSEKIEVAELAEALGVSERTLRRHFQKDLNCSVMEYIHQQRLRLAQIHLTHHQSVAEVARRVGFDSAGQLSRLFRKQLGVSPKRWQKLHAPTRRFPSDAN